MKTIGATGAVMNDIKNPSCAAAAPPPARYTAKYFVIQPPMTE